MARWASPECQYHTHTVPANECTVLWGTCGCVLQDTETGKSAISEIRTSSGMFFLREEDAVIAGAPASALPHAAHKINVCGCIDIRNTRSTSLSPNGRACYARVVDASLMQSVAR